MTAYRALSTVERSGGITANEAAEAMQRIPPFILSDRGRGDGLNREVTPLVGEQDRERQSGSL